MFFLFSCFHAHRDCFTKTKIDFKLDFNIAGRSCHCFLSTFTGIGLSNHGHKCTELTFFDNSLLKEKIISKDHNGESNQWHE